jgi:hypothetical protein
MTTTAADVDRLREAIQLIMEVRSCLDNSSDPCPGCGGSRYRNWTEHGSHEALSGAIGRLEKVIRWLEGGDRDR